jgi:hypothetical protein
MKYDFGGPGWNPSAVSNSHSEGFLSDIKLWASDYYVSPFRNVNGIFGGACRAIGRLGDGMSVRGAFLYFRERMFRSRGVSSGNRELPHTQNYLPISIGVSRFHFGELVVVNDYSQHAYYDQKQAVKKSPKSGPAKQSSRFAYEIRQSIYGFGYILLVCSAWFGGLFLVAGGWRMMSKEWRVGVCAIVFGVIMIYGFLRLVYHAAILLTRCKLSA